MAQASQLLGDLTAFLYAADADPEARRIIALHDLEQHVLHPTHRQPGKNMHDMKRPVMHARNVSSSQFHPNGKFQLF
jgi:hypothetical protein